MQESFKHLKSKQIQEPCKMKKIESAEPKRKNMNETENAKKKNRK